MVIMPSNFVVEYPEALSIPLLEAALSRAATLAGEIVRDTPACLRVHPLAHLVHFLFRIEHLGDNFFGKDLRADGSCDGCLKGPVSGRSRVGRRGRMMQFFRRGSGSISRQLFLRKNKNPLSFAAKLRSEPVSPNFHLFQRQRAFQTLHQNMTEHMPPGHFRMHTDGPESAAAFLLEMHGNDFFSGRREAGNRQASHGGVLLGGQIQNGGIRSGLAGLIIKKRMPSPISVAATR
jgi:hypothetical protein